MLANPRSDRVRAVRALQKRSVRERTGRFAVEGPQGVREAVRYAADRVRDVYVTAEAAARYAADVVEPSPIRAWRTSRCRVEATSGPFLDVTGEVDGVDLGSPRRGAVARCAWRFP